MDFIADTPIYNYILIRHFQSITRNYIGTLYRYPKYFNKLKVIILFN